MSVSLLAVVLGLAAWGYAVPTADSSALHQAAVGVHRDAPPAPNQIYDIDSAPSLTVVVNKARPLGQWAPTDLTFPTGLASVNGAPLRAEATAALEALNAQAVADGIQIHMTSGYRSYETQERLFDAYSRASGTDLAETYSARAGHSEHQTGLAIDIDDGSGCRYRSCFADTPLGLWMAENAHTYGFILRYPEGAQDIVGFKYEPWHYRYVGVEVATDMHDRGIETLEEYFDLPAAPNY